GGGCAGGDGGLRIVDEIDGDDWWRGRGRDVCGERGWRCGGHGYGHRYGWNGNGHGHGWNGDGRVDGCGRRRDDRRRRGRRRRGGDGRGWLGGHGELRGRHHARRRPDGADRVGARALPGDALLDGAGRQPRLRRL